MGRVVGWVCGCVGVRACELQLSLRREKHHRKLAQDPHSRTFVDATALRPSLDTGARLHNARQNPRGGCRVIESDVINQLTLARPAANMATQVLPLHEEAQLKAVKERDE